MVRCCAFFLAGLLLATFALPSLAHAQCYGGNCYGGYGGYGGGFYPGIYAGNYIYGAYQGSPYGVYYQPSTGYSSYYLPPTFTPAELNYGPQAVKQFMGVDRNFGLSPLLNPPAPMAEPTDAVAQLAAILARQKQVEADAKAGTLPVTAARVSGVDARNQAYNAIRTGDARYMEQDLAGALARYRSATEAAPDVSDGWFRYGLVNGALGQPQRAAAAMRRGLALYPAWPTSKFSLKPIYDDKPLAKTSHLEGLAKAAIDNPADPDAYFVLGVFLHFTGEPDRARAFLEEAEKLGDEKGAGVFLGPKT